MKHALTFRGQDHTIPAGYGKCTRCGALLDMETWLDQECRPDVNRDDLEDMRAELKATRGDDDAEV